MGPEFAHRLGGDIAAAEAFLGEDVELGTRMATGSIREEGAGFMGRRICI